MRSPLSGAYRHIYHRTGQLFEHQFSSVAFPLEEWGHVALVTDIHATLLQLFYNGNEVLSTSLGWQALPSSGGSVTVGEGDAGGGLILMDDIRLRIGKHYS